MSRHNKGKRRPRPKSTAPQVPPRAPHRTQPTLEERPKAPWHPIPLIELSVLIGIVCIGVGFFSRDNASGRTLLALGFVLGALGGLDTAAREHFSGYRSHTLVLAGFPAVAAAVLAAFARLPHVFIPVLLVGVFMAAFLALRRAWERSAS